MKTRGQLPWPIALVTVAALGAISAGAVAMALETAAFQELQEDRALAAGWPSPLMSLGYIVVFFILVQCVTAGVCGAAVGAKRRKAAFTAQ